MAQLTFQIIAKNIENTYAADEVQPSYVEKHGGEKREELFAQREVGGKVRNRVATRTNPYLTRNLGRLGPSRIS